MTELFNLQIRSLPAVRYVTIAYINGCGCLRLMQRIMTPFQRYVIDVPTTYTLGMSLHL